MNRLSIVLLVLLMFVTPAIAQTDAGQCDESTHNDYRDLITIQGIGCKLFWPDSDEDCNKCSKTCHKYLDQCYSSIGQKKAKCLCENLCLPEEGRSKECKERDGKTVE